MFTITIAGRPNVGKSTLFNALAGRMIAITDQQAGTTRDIIEAPVTIRDEEGRFVRARLIDAGGMGIIDEPGLAPKVEEKIRGAIDAADVILFVVDARTGITDLDHAAADRLKRLGKPVILVANKCETEEWEREAHVFGRLGLGEPLTAVAQEKRNLADIRAALTGAAAAGGTETEEAAPAKGAVDEADEDERFRSRRGGPMRLAVLGRRNSGKSTFVNALAGQERCIVSEIPGTTRDAIDIEMEFAGEKMMIIDTAGITRKREGKSTIEFKSTVRTERAIKRSDVVMLFTDAVTRVGRLERDAFRKAMEHYKPIIIVVNKWDLSTVGTGEYLEYLEKKLSFAGDLPVAFISSLEGSGVKEVVETAIELYKLSGTRMGTGELNRVIDRIVKEHSLPAKGSRAGKIYYAVQTGTYPPEYKFFVNDAKIFSGDYIRYVRRRIAGEIGSEEIPVRIRLESRRSRKGR
ncbi:MAG: ribosome biogenesis GTPase Der [Planctomycetes bacterium]|nr:ribosome biogenesis GTPase Der [Planctomycetota bacterium]